MSEQHCNSTLKNKTYKIKDDLKFVSSASIDLSHSGVTSKTITLPLSLENNSTLAGTGMILDQFAKEFSIPSSSNIEGLPFDSNTKTFCLKKARDHAEFNILLSHHKGQAELFSSQLSEGDLENDDESLNVQNLTDSGEVDDGNASSCEKDDSNEFDTDELDSNELGSNGVYHSETTVESVQKLFREQDKLFNSVFDSLKNKLWNSIQADTVEHLIKDMSENSQLMSVKDHLGRSLLHAAVEQQNVKLVQCLLHAGVNPNSKEACGITPVLIAVITKNKEICQLLVKSQASVRGPLFANVPSPLAVALQIEEAEIYKILSPVASDEEHDVIAAYDPGFVKIENMTSDKDGKGNKIENNCNRGSPGFITGIVGDVGICKTTRGVISRSDVHKWIGLIPGDLHTKGYFAEGCFKEQGPGGFHYLVNKVLKRAKLTTEAFKKKKFSEGYLDRIREAVRDGARSYGLAAILEFKNSDLFPSVDDQKKCIETTGSHTKVFLERFKQWLERSSDSSASFCYRSQLFLFYGPLLELFDISTKHCWGKAREACYILQLPMYAHMGFKNYYSECFIHAMNFLGKWPVAFRQLLSNNCSINLSGQKAEVLN